MKKKEIVEAFNSIHKSAEYLQGLFGTGAKLNESFEQVVEMVGGAVSFDKIIVVWKSQERGRYANFFLSGDCGYIGQAEKEIISSIAESAACEFKASKKPPALIMLNEAPGILSEHDITALDLHNPLFAPIACNGTFIGGMLCDSCNPGEWTGENRNIITGACDFLAFAILHDRNKAELAEAKVNAEQASRSKNEFLSRINHELRTPLNTIIGMTRIGGRSGNLNKSLECIENIDKASRQLLSIINDILDMSKIESNKLVISEDVFNLENMLINIANEYALKADEKKQDFRVYIDLKAPKYYFGDEARISQVIVNLLSNAVKFSPDGGMISLDVNLLDVNGDLAHLRFGVTDSGIGIKPDSIKRLFELFEQEDGGTSRKYGGTGLGLTLCKRIVEMMGGEIRVASVPGSGSVFSFVIPLKIFKEGPGTEKALHGIDMSLVNVLLIDDDPAAREYFLKIMRSFRIKAKACASYKEAVITIDEANAIKRPFNIIFVDYYMPVVNGIEATRRLKKRNEGATIIMVSSIDKTDIEKEAKEAGVFKIITKPLFPSMMLDEINKIVGVSGEFLPNDVNVIDFSKITMLLAEDAEINREIIHKMLKETGINIDFVENGEEAVKKFEKNPEKYDIVFMDVDMPLLNGYEATKKIRLLPHKYAMSAPIVAMTANVFAEDKKKCFEAGMNDHISKPIDANELMDKIIKYGAHTKAYYGIDEISATNINAASGSAANGYAASGSTTYEDIASGRDAHENAASGRAVSGYVASGRATYGDITNGRYAHGDAASGRATNGDAAYGRATNGDIANGRDAHGDTANDSASYESIANDSASYERIITGYKTNESAVDGIIVDEITVEGSKANGGMVQRSILDGNIDRGRIINGRIIDGRIVNGSVDRGRIIDGRIVNGRMVNGSIDKGSLVSGITVNGNTANGNTANGSIASRSTVNGSITNRSTANGNTANGSIANGSIANGSIASGSTANGSTRIIKASMSAEDEAVDGKENPSIFQKGNVAKKNERGVSVMQINDFSDSDLEKYVNYKEALGRVRGNTRVYKTLLRSFTQNTNLEKLKEEIERKDNQAAAATAHVIKGVTANLSLTVAYDIIVTLESQLKNNYDASESLMNFEVALEKTLEYIDVVLDKIE